MIIREIKTGELSRFVESPEYRLMDPKPVTLIRAFSQSMNPRATAEDTALLIAVEGNNLLAMVGLLPDYMDGDPLKTVSSNTGWWANPTSGRHVALPLFARAMKACHSRMFLTDATMHTREILEKTGWFHFTSPQPGRKVVFRSYTGQFLRQKGINRMLSRIGGAVDKLLNLTALPLLELFEGRENNSVTMEESQRFDDSMKHFIEIHNSAEFTRRGPAEIEWAMKWKWLQTKVAESAENYPFSLYAESFSQTILSFKRDGKLFGIAVISIRDGHGSVPYFYAENGSEEDVWASVIKYLKKVKALTCTSYQEGWTDFTKENRRLYLAAKKVSRYTAVTKELLPLWQQNPKFQDGDGDNIFT